MYSFTLRAMTPCIIMPYVLNSLVETGGEDVPLPRALVPNTVTVILSERGQDDKGSSNTFWQTPRLQEVAGIVANPQLVPDVVSA